MENSEEGINKINVFLQELETLANRARKEYEITKDVSVEKENFDRLENKIFKFLRQNVSQKKANRFNSKLHPRAFGFSMSIWANFINLHLKPAVSYLEGLRQAIEKEDVELIFNESSGKTQSVKKNGYVSLYDSLSLHASIVEVSRNLYADGYYSQAIFEAFKNVNRYVKKKSKQSRMDGQKLMARVFSEKTPIIKLNKLETESDINEQMGFRMLFMGSMTGIRNPKAHDAMKLKDPIRALKYLTLASLLFERAEEGELVE